MQEGLQFHAVGRCHDAVAAFKRASQADPRSPHAPYLLGIAYAELAEGKKAADSMAEAFRLGLRDAAARFQYAMVLLRGGDPKGAIASLEIATELMPDFAEAHEILGNIAYEQCRYKPAEEHYRKAIAAKPKEWSYRHNLALALYMQLRYDEAIATLETVADLAPNKADAYGTQALLLEMNNQIEAAQEKAEQSLAHRPDHPEGLLVLAKIARRNKRFDEALGALDKVESGRLKQWEAVTYWNERGRICDAVGRYDEAFRAFHRSKRTLADFRQIRFDFSLWDRTLGAAERLATSLAERKIPSEQDNGKLAFILGFHRSGTTLLERMLGRHENICPGGELLLLAELESELSQRMESAFPDCLARMNDDQRADAQAELRALHRKGLGAKAPHWDGRGWITDKSPLNSAHMLMLRWLFPQAPVVRIIRHPLDTVLSCYFENFLAGNEWSYDIADIARLYLRVHEHFGVMAERLGGPVMEVRYEELVQEPEPVLRRVLDFLGEAWDPNCLEFHRHDQAARTASYAQVTQPLYRSSISRYSNYLNHLEDQVLSVLNPLIDELGYPKVTPKPGTPLQEMER